MLKPGYEDAYIEIIRLESADILTASDGGNIDNDTQTYEWYEPED